MQTVRSCPDPRSLLRGASKRLCRSPTTRPPHNRLSLSPAAGSAPRATRETALSCAYSIHLIPPGLTGSNSDGLKGALLSGKGRRHAGPTGQQRGPSSRPHTAGESSTGSPGLHRVLPEHCGLGSGAAQAVQLAVTLRDTPLPRRRFPILFPHLSHWSLLTKADS